MAAKKKEESHPPPPVVRYAPLGELKIYQVQEHELDQLAAGSPSSIYFNFAAFLAPIGITLIVVMATTTIESNRLFVSFLAVAVITIIASLVLFALWIMNLVKSRSLLREIKSRMSPPEPIERAAVEFIEVKETVAVTKIVVPEPPSAVAEPPTERAQPAEPPLIPQPPPDPKA